jgi:hypothetical protein
VTPKATWLPEFAKNWPQRALRGIHISLPRHNTGWLVFVPSTNKIYHSVDVYFDENFESTLAITNSRSPGYIDAVTTDASPVEDLHVERTHEDYDLDLDLASNDLDFSATPSRGSHFEEKDEDDHDDYIPTHDNYIPTDSTCTSSNDDDAYNTSTRQNSFANLQLVPSVIDTSANNRTSRFPTRKRQPPQRFQAYPASSQPLPIPDEHTDHVQSAYNTEVLQPLLDATNVDPLAFLPAPKNWRNIIMLPPHLQKFGAVSLLIELKEVIWKGIFIVDTLTSEDPIISVIAKFRVKLTTDGTIDKLNSRIALRGDLMRNNVQIPDTWCPGGDDEEEDDEIGTQIFTKE